MANRLKEDEKNERIIRGLLKLQENRRCINCNSLGPQYVCTNFWTFVCTTCSGIHREFTHRVKSISMAKFTSQEVGALQEGGNQRAKDIYFKELDPQRHSFPDSSNVMRLRDFIKHVYVDRRYSGDKNFDKPPRVKSGEKDDYYENRRTDTYQGGSRSPPYEDRRYNEKSSPGGRNFDERRSPGSDHENRQFGDFRRSPARPEVVNDWRREDRFGNGKRVEDGRLSDGDSKIGGRSPERPNDLDAASPPMVRPVRDILGENVSPLRVIEPPKSSGGSKVADSSVHKQRTASSSSLGSISENVVETKLEPSGSLIDFDAEPEPSTSTVPQPPQSSASQSVTHTVNSNSDNNWASFDVPQAPPAPTPAPANVVGTLESVLSQLSVSAAVPGVSGSHGVAGAVPTAPVGNMTMLSTGFDPSFGSGGNTHMPPPFAGGAPSAAPGTGLSTFPPSGQWSNIQSQAHSLFPGGNSQPVGQQFPPSIDRSINQSINQPWNASLSANSQGLSNPAAHVPAPQDFSSPAQATASASGRKELPADLFTLSYSSYPAPVPGWHTVPLRPMGYVMPYNSPMPVPNFPQSSPSTNPFDLSSEQSQFPSMAPLQNALPSGQPASNFIRIPGYGNPTSTWMPHQPQPPSNLSQLPPPASFPSTMPSRPPYMGQQVASNVQPYRHPGLGNYGTEGTAHGYTDMSQQTAGRFLAPATPNPFSSTGGNPFG